jgi:hypothetical protein
MKEKLQGMLLGYIRENNPDLFQQLDEDDALHAWVLEKLKEVEMVLNQSRPNAALEAQCMDIMTADLRPSRMRYLRDLFEERFSGEHDLMLASGTLTYELMEMVSACHDLFEDNVLLDGIDHPELDRLIVKRISTYLHSQREFYVEDVPYQ